MFWRHLCSHHAGAGIESPVGPGATYEFLLLALVLGFVPLAGFDGSRQAAAGTTQVALFLGFGSSPNTDSGMDILNTTLSAAGIPNFAGMVFRWGEKQEAFDWIQQQNDLSTLVLIGHSFGANSALQLSNNFLLDEGIEVDLTVQIDSVENFDGETDARIRRTVYLGGLSFWAPTLLLVRQPVMQVGFHGLV